MNFWKTISNLAVAIGGLALLVCVCLLFFPKISQQNELQEKRDVLEDENRQMEERIRELRRKRERFTTDPEYARRIAHEEGYASKDELIFRFEVPVFETNSP